MRMKYLGTAAAEGWPALFCQCEACVKAKQLGGKNIRTRSQCIIDDTLLVDFPPDTYMHVLNNQIDLPSIEHLIVTHTHQDHFYPLDLILRGYPYAHLVKNNKLHIYGTDHVGEMYEAALAAEGDSPDIRELVEFHEVTEFIPFQAGEYKVTPLLANHDKRRKCYIYIIDKDDKRILYANDTGDFPEATWKYLKSAGLRFDLVSYDCTSVMHPEGTNHMGIPDNKLVTERLRAMNCIEDQTQIVLTHFSHNGKLMHEEIEQEAAKYGFKVAYDGYEIEF
jgi:phosphoribosyl 1,2-cyclic phosphate phosphodiesterase